MSLDTVDSLRGNFLPYQDCIIIINEIVYLIEPLKSYGSLLIKCLNMLVIYCPCILHNMHVIKALNYLSNRQQHYISVKAPFLLCYEETNGGNLDVFS